MVKDTFSIVFFKESTDTSEKVILFPLSCKSNMLRSVNADEMAYEKNGFIRLRKNFEIPLIITITNINGQLINRGVLIPDK